MARKREQNITESGAELRELAGRYAGKAQEGRLLFLAWLKETPGSTIGQAARAAGLSERQGRYLWDDYCAGGLERVIGRRVYQPKGKKKPEKGAAVPDPGRVAGMTAADMVGFMNAVGELASINDPAIWVRRLGDILRQFILEIEYAVVSVQLTAGITSQPSRVSGVNFVFTQHIRADGRRHFTSFSSPEKYESNYERLIEQGRQIGFPFESYHFPPYGFDFYKLNSDRTHLPYRESLPDIVGSIILFGSREAGPLSFETVELIEKLRSFISGAFESLILRAQWKRPEFPLFADAALRILGKLDITTREQEILRLLLLGNTHDEIADLLNVTRSTVNKHTRSVFRKAGVRRLSEFFARYFTPRDHFPEQESRETDPDSGMGE